jgi:hypothetical protein
VDPATGALATSGCPGAQLDAFIAGTQPVEGCRLHGGSLASATQVTGWDTGSEEPAATASGGTQRAAGGAPVRHQPAAAKSVGPTAAAQAPAPPEKKGWFRRILDVFK